MWPAIAALAKEAIEEAATKGKLSYFAPLLSDTCRVIIFQYSMWRIFCLFFSDKFWPTPGTAFWLYLFSYVPFLLPAMADPWCKESFMQYHTVIAVLCGDVLSEDTFTMHPALTWSHSSKLNYARFHFNLEAEKILWGKGIIERNNARKRVSFAASAALFPPGGL